MRTLLPLNAPLVYALKMDEKWEKKEFKEMKLPSSESLIMK